MAEYCVRGSIDELPLKNIQILPFNLDQSIKTGKFADVIFTANSANKEKLYPRAIIPNDAKLFAQADLDNSINYFVTSDARSKKTFSALSNEIRPNFNIIDISTPYNEMFGILDL